MNLPNKLTVFRVILIPFCLYFFYSQMAYGGLIALALFMLASFTDYLDGYLARRDNLVTDFGKLMDPLADKLLVISLLIAFLDIGILPAVGLMLIVAREFIVTSLRLVGANKGVVLAADIYGKSKTVLQMLYIIVTMFILGMHGMLSEGILLTLSNIGFALMVAMVVMTIFSGANYVIKNKNLFMENK